MYNKCNNLERGVRMKKITGDMLIAELLNYGDTEKIANVLFSFGMHCLGCALAHGETIAQAAEAHGADLDEMIAKLNEACGL